MKRFFHVPVLGSLLFLALACSRDTYVEPVELDGITNKKTRTSHYGGYGSSDDVSRSDRAPVVRRDGVLRDERPAKKTPDGPVQSFSKKLLAASANASSVGCLPLVSYELDKKGPFVTELGVKLADEVSLTLAELGYQGNPLGTPDMEVRLAEANLAKKSLSTLAAVVAQGDRLGVDVVVFGTIKKDVDNRARGFRDFLDIDLLAYSLVDNRLVARESWQIYRNRNENRRRWLQHERGSLWEASVKWQVPQSKRTFDNEMRVATQVLAKRLKGILGRASSVSSSASKIYLPPVDCAAFVRSIARLRAAQMSFASEYERRAEALAAAQNSAKKINENEVLTDAQTVDPKSVLNSAGSIVLNDVEFATLQAAESYLNTLRNTLLTGKTARFAQSISSMLAESIHTEMADADVSVKDIGFTNWSEPHLLEAGLATGGLTGALSSRRALVDQGIGHVIVPRFERFGTNILLRIEVLDLEKQRMAGSTHFRFDACYDKALAAALATDDYGSSKPQKIKDLGKVEQQSWDKVYEGVASGVVSLSGGKTRGTGFVVSNEGHILTNAHVVRSMKSKHFARFLGGVLMAFTIIHVVDALDLALVKVARLPQRTHVFRFARSARVRVGMEVAVLGHPKSSKGWVFTPGHMSSLNVNIGTNEKDKNQDGYMYTSATRGGSSGSPVILLDGSVAAVHKAGSKGFLNTSSGVKGSELTGFARGIRGQDARAFLVAQSVLPAR